MNNLGRLYSNTAFLNFQADDISKSLLIFEEGAVLGKEGLFWLLLYAANVWGYDKEDLAARVEFSGENLGEWLEYAKDPINNLGWTKAEKAWSFLAVCFELKLMMDWVEAGHKVENFVSNFICFIDGSNNGR